MFETLCELSTSRFQSEQFKSGDLCEEWFRVFPELFDEDDIRVARTQAKQGLHYFEWLSALTVYQSLGYLSLIEKYGWYSSKNNGDNADGVSRDHIVSVRYGFDNDISPDVISHPANCQLMQQVKNSSKNSKCGMTLEELKLKIEEWNKKYKQ